jgi:hypothetical protein
VGGKPKLDRIITRALETDAAVNAFVNGEVDVNEITVDASAYKRVSSVKGAEVRVAGGPDFRHITFNGTSPNLSDPKVRQAIAMAINRQAIAKADLTGLPWPARTMDNHFLVNTQAGYKENAGTVGQFNPEQAKRMLDEAGWKAERHAPHEGRQDARAALRDPDRHPGQPPGGRAHAGDAARHRRQARHPRGAERRLLRQVHHPGQLRPRAVLVDRDAVPDLLGAVDLRMFLLCQGEVAVGDVAVDGDGGRR